MICIQFSGCGGDFVQFWAGLLVSVPRPHSVDLCFRASKARLGWLCQPVVRDALCLCQLWAPGH